MKHYIFIVLLLCSIKLHSQLFGGGIVSKPSKIVDGDGNVYTSVVIGTQTWLKENLRTKSFRDGTPLDNVTSLNNTDWNNANGSSTRYWAYVNGDDNNTSTYGLLYNQYAVFGSTSGGASSGNLCPAGYHAPTASEFTTLNDYLSVDGQGGAGTNVAEKLKSTTLWYDNGNGTNSSGFDAKPAGFRAGNGPYSDLTFFTYYWTTDSGTMRELAYVGSNFTQRTNYTVKAGYSVRCIKD